MKAKRIILILVLFLCMSLALYKFIQPKKTVNKSDINTSKNTTLQDNAKIKDFKVSLSRINAKGFVMGWYDDSKILMTSDSVMDYSELLKDCINTGVYKWKTLNLYNTNSCENTIMFKDRIITCGLISPDRKKLVFADVSSDNKKNIYIKDLINNNEKRLFSTDRVFDINWSDNGKFLTILTIDCSWVYDVEKDKVRKIPTLGCELKVSNDGSKILINKNDKLILMDISSNNISEKTISNVSIDAFDFYDNKILFTSSFNKKEISSLCVYDQSTEKTTEILDNCGNFSLNKDKDIILASDYVGGRVYVYHINNEIVSDKKEVFNGHINNKVFWNSNGSKAIFYGGERDIFNYYVVNF